jgi:hypothetical protein
MAKQGRGRKFGRRSNSAATVVQIQLQDLRIEPSQFPHGKHDDQCDALGLAGQPWSLAGRAAITRLTDKLIE